MKDRLEGLLKVRDGLALVSDGIEILTNLEAPPHVLEADKPPKKVCSKLIFLDYKTKQPAEEGKPGYIYADAPEAAILKAKLENQGPITEGRYAFRLSHGRDRLFINRKPVPNF